MIPHTEQRVRQVLQSMVESGYITGFAHVPQNTEWDSKGVDFWMVVPNFSNDEELLPLQVKGRNSMNHSSKYPSIPMVKAVSSKGKPKKHHILVGEIKEVIFEFLIGNIKPSILKEVTGAGMKPPRVESAKPRKVLNTSHSYTTGIRDLREVVKARG